MHKLIPIVALSAAAFCLLAVPPLAHSLPDSKQARPIRTALPWTLSPTAGPSAHRLPARAPTVMLHAPVHLAPQQPMSIVLFFHGWNGCVRMLGLTGEVGCRRHEEPRSGWGLNAAHDSAQTNSLFVIPQLAWRARTGRPGRLLEPGFARQWLNRLIRDEVTARLGHSLPNGLSDFERIIVIAHSAGYEAAWATLRRGEISDQVSHVILLDALYGRVDEFLDWTLASPNRRLLSVHTTQGGPRRNTRRLLREAEDARPGLNPPQLSELGEIDFQGHPIQALETNIPHGEIPGAMLGQLVRAASR